MVVAVSVVVAVIVVTLCSAIQMNFYRKIRTNKHARNSHTRICVPMPSVRDDHRQEQQMSDRPDSDNIQTTAEASVSPCYRTTL